MNRSVDSPIKVLIVEDSDSVRLLLNRIISADPRLQVVGAVPDGQAALQALDRLSPDVISMDIRMPRMNGFEATRRIMATKPTPIVVCSASIESEDLKISMNAMRAGALTVVEKPVGLTNADYELLAKRLCQQLVLMSSVKLVRQRYTAAGLARRDAASDGAAFRSTKEPLAPACGYAVLGVVASTGGPQALAALLSGLGSDFPLPVLVVQHMTSSFVQGFASWLNDTVPMPVSIAADRQLPAPGCAYIAPADAHLRFDGVFQRLSSDPPIAGQRPAGTVLLESLATSCGPRAIGVVLTGMGDDGACGLKALHAAGGLTIAEHESTAIVYGMPAAAVAMNAVHHVIPLPQIARRIRESIDRVKAVPT